MADASLPITGLVLVEQKTVYGIDLYYPANALARAFCDLKDSRTVTPTMVSHLKAMGLRVQTNGTDPKEL